MLDHYQSLTCSSEPAKQSEHAKKATLNSTTIKKDEIAEQHPAIINNQVDQGLPTKNGTKTHKNSSCSCRGWRGWLFKRGRGLFGSWRRRWFELRRNPHSAASEKYSKFSCTELYYYRPSRCSSDGTGSPQRLDVEIAVREAAMDCDAGAVLSIKVSGRQGRMLLAAESAADAESLLQMLDERLNGREVRHLAGCSQNSYAV